MQNLTETVLSTKNTTLHQYLSEHNYDNLVNKLCVMETLYNNYSETSHTEKLRYVESMFPVVYKTLMEYQSKLDCVHSVVNRIVENDGSSIVTTSAIDSSVPRIYNKNEKEELNAIRRNKKDKDKIL